MKTEERVLRLENAFSTLIELARTQSERMDEYGRRTEELAQGQKELTRAQTELTEAQTGLAEAQKQTEANLSALMTIVAELGRAQLRTEQALANLSEKVDRYISGS
jgi:uncharacterized protein YoxC